MRKASERSAHEQYTTTEKEGPRSLRRVTNGQTICG